MPPTSESDRGPRLRVQRLRKQLIEPLFAVIPEASNLNLPPLIVRNRRERAKQRLAVALSSLGTDEVPGPLRDELEGLVMSWARRHFDDGFADVEAFEIQCAEEGDVVVAEVPQAMDTTQDMVEWSYRQVVLDRHGTLEIHGLPAGEPAIMRLDLGFAPLYLMGDSPPRTLRVGDMAVQVAPREPAAEVLQQHEHVLLVGGAGSGKTTLVNFLAARSASAGLRAGAGWRAEPVPFVVPVRALDKPRLDEDTIAWLSGCERSFVDQVLGKRRAHVLIDGLDEATGEAGARLMRAIGEFAQRHPGNRLLLTSRPLAPPARLAPPLPSFAERRLLPLGPEDVEGFVDRWYALVMPPADPAAQEALRAATAPLKAFLRQSRPAARLAETPLLCATLCIAYHGHGQRLPAGRGALYELCAGVLHDERQHARSPEPALREAKLRWRLLADLAAFMHRAHVTDLPAAWAVRRFAAQLPAMGRGAGEAARLLERMTARSHLLQHRRGDHLAFAHPIFQEYLTALHYVSVGRPDALLASLPDPFWQDVIVLGSALRGLDAGRLLRGLLDADPAGAGAGTLLAARCLDAVGEAAPALREEVEQRIARLLPITTEEGVRQVVAFGEAAAAVLLRALQGQSGPERAALVAALGELRHEPAAGHLLPLLAEGQPTPLALTLTLPGGAQATLPAGAELARVAALALLCLADSSRGAEAGMRRALSAAAVHPAAIDTLRGLGAQDVSPPIARVLGALL